MIEATIPLTPLQINQICSNNKQNKRSWVTIDLKDCNLTDEHLLGYLSNLGIDCQLINFDSELFVHYLTSQFMIGRTNLAKLHCNLLAWYINGKPQDVESINMFEKVPENIIKEHLEIISHIPSYLKVNSNSGIVPTEIRNDTFGSNLYHLLEFDSMVMTIANERLFDETNITYYRHMDDYVFNGKNFMYYYTNSSYDLVIDMVTQRLRDI